MYRTITIHEAPENVVIGRSPSARTTQEFTALLGVGIDLKSLSETNRAMATELRLSLDKVFRAALTENAGKGVKNFTQVTLAALRDWAAQGERVVDREFRGRVVGHFEELSDQGIEKIGDLTTITKRFANEGIKLVTRAMNEQAQASSRMNKGFEDAKKVRVKTNELAKQEANAIRRLRTQFNKVRADIKDTSLNTKSFAVAMREATTASGGLLTKTQAAKKVLVDFRQELEKQTRAEKKAADAAREETRQLDKLNFLYKEIQNKTRGATRSTRSFEDAMRDLKMQSRGAFNNLEAGREVLKRFRQGQTKAKKTTGFLSDAFAKNASQVLILVGIFGTARFIIGDLIQGISELSRGFFELADNAAKLSDAEVAFRRLAEAQAKQGESAAVALAKIREAAGGTIDELTLIGTATKAALAGLDPQIFDKIVRGARALAVVTGRDTAESVDRLTQAIAKQERRLLDELGIVIRANDAYKDFARSIGISTNELTANQKQLAFSNAVLQEIENKVTDLGGVIEFAQGPFIRFRAAVRDTTLSMGEAIRQSEAFQGVLGGLSQAVEEFGDSMKGPVARIAELSSGIDIATENAKNSKKVNYYNKFK